MLASPIYLHIFMKRGELTSFLVEWKDCIYLDSKVQHETVWMSFSQLVKEVSPCCVCYHLLEPCWSLSKNRAAEQYGPGGWKKKSTCAFRTVLKVSKEKHRIDASVYSLKNSLLLTSQIIYKPSMARSGDTLPRLVKAKQLVIQY